MIIAILSKKGGVGKSVSAMYIAALLEEQHRRAAVVDFDPEGTALAWSRRTRLPYPVYGMGELKEAIESKRHLIIDTPPNDAKTLGAAARAADRCILVARSNLLEVDRLKPSLDALAASGFEGRWGLLLTQLPTGKLGPEVKQALEENGIPVLGTIPSRVEYQRAFGEVPTRLWDYEAALRSFL